MSKFKEQLMQDNANTFFNESEFAFSINWNGHPLVVTDETPTESTQFTHGIESETVIYRCDSTSLSPRPVVNERVNINGQLWRVSSVQSPGNDLVIRLERHQS